MFKYVLGNPEDLFGSLYKVSRTEQVCEISITRLHVNGTATQTSDAGCKESIKVIHSTTCYDIVKYIKPKESIFVGKESQEIGLIAQDIPTSKMPKHGSKVVVKDTDDEYFRLNYIKMNVVLWSAVQHLMSEVKAEITKVTGKGKGKT